MLGGTEKIILDSGAANGSRGRCPTCRLTRLRAGPTSAANRRQRRPAMRPILPAALSPFSHRCRLMVAYSALFTVYQTEQALVIRLGEPVDGDHRTGSPRKGAVHRQRRLHRQAHPRSGSSSARSDRLGPEAAGGRCFRSVQVQNPLRFYQTVGTTEAANTRLSTLLISALRRVSGESTFIQVVRDERPNSRRECASSSIGSRRFWHQCSRCADQARRPPRAE